MNYNQKGNLNSNFKHGFSKTPTYMVWIHMKRRCYIKTDPSYKNYGGRGIKVCLRWRTFNNFLEDMGKKPERLSLERINNNLGYSLVNCKWASAFEQTNNQRRNRRIKFMGVKMTMSQWAREFGLSYELLRTRICKYNWPLYKAFLPSQRDL